MLEKFKNDFLFFDGAMGTILQETILKVGDIPEELNIKNPDVILNIHKEYLKAGANIIKTNTFGANRLKLKNIDYSVDQVISKALDIAKQANKDFKQYIALDIGPTGSLLSPLGNLSFEEAYDIFKEQIISGAANGADLILIETMSDLYELKAAILAAKENSDLPVFCTMTFQEDKRTFTGTDVPSFVFLAESLGVNALGVNCSLGPRSLQTIIDELLKFSSIPVIVQANAGLPKQKDNKTYYDVSSGEYSNEIQIMAKKGVRIFGGCCGTTPEYIKDIIKNLKPLSPLIIEKKHFTTAVSSSKTVFFGDEVKIIGERINPTGKKLLKEALKSNNIDYVLKEAIAQLETGADVLDINVGLPDIDEEKMMVKIVKEVQSLVPLPLQIDSSDAKVIESALRIYNGKPIINSVNGKQESLKEILPIAKKYGSLLIALTLDENGIPSTAKKRFEIAKNIIETAKTNGINEENILIDPLVLTASAEQENVLETLKAIPLIKEKYNVKIVLGTSNVSFGLPNRQILNSTYLAMALAYGLDAPITDPTNEGLMAVINSFKVLANQDKDSENYIKKYAVQNTNIDSKILDKTGKNSNSSLKDAIINGLKDEAEIISQNLLNQYEPIKIIDEMLMPALDIVGQKYENKEIFLPQLIRSAETSKIVFEKIKQSLNKDDNKKIGEKIILATVKGDIHDIGKNIVKLLLENYGYEVIDLGKDVDAESIISKIKSENVSLVGLSALMTTTVKNMEAIIKAIKAEAPSTKIMVGGAVLTQEYADKIGADYYSKDAAGAIDIAKAVFKGV